MTALVLDCSVTMACCFEEDGTPFARRVVDLLDEQTGWVPSVWPLEVANAIVMAERRDRIARNESQQFLEMLGGLPIVIDQHGSDRAWGGILKLARDHRLSSYDAAYLELALRNGLALATLDEALRRAAEQLKVDVLE